MKSVVPAPARRGLWLASTAILLTAAAGSFATMRMVRAGNWLPTVPESVGYWESQVVPPDPIILKMLGKPRMIGRTYRNPFGDRVEFSLVTAGMFENYHDPTICVGGGAYRLTGTRELPFSGDKGPNRARAMLFRHRKDPNQRIILWYWQQFRDGSTDTESRMGNFRDFPARLRTGYGAVVLGKQTVLARVFTPFDIRTDADGSMAQDRVRTIASAVYSHLRGKQ